MIVITRGSVKVSIGDIVVDIMGRGAVIGEMAVLAGVPRTANVVADSSVTALVVNHRVDAVHYGRVSRVIRKPLENCSDAFCGEPYWGKVSLQCMGSNAITPLVK